MYRILLPTKRPFNGKALCVLLALLMVAVPMALPFSLTRSPDRFAELEQELAETGLFLPIWFLLITDSMVRGLLIGISGMFGLLIASRIGLGMPFIEGWADKQPIWNRLPKVLAIAITTGLIVGLIIAGMDKWFFGPKIETLIESEGITVSEEIKPSAWQGFLVAIATGVTEETVFRLFGLTLFAWFSSGAAAIGKTAFFRPRPYILWFANISIAAVFGLYHLVMIPVADLSSIPPLADRAIVLNGIAGLAFGWLYWRFGLEASMVAHFSADVVLHVILSLVARSAGTPALSTAYLVGGLLIMLAIAAALWRFGPDWQESDTALESVPVS